MECANINLPVYKTLLEEYGPGAVNAAHALFSTPEFITFYGPNLPIVDSTLQIINNAGQSFDVKAFLSERKSLVAQQNGLGNYYEIESTAQKVANIFNSTNDRSKQFEAVVQKKGDGFTTTLKWRKEAKPITPIAFSQTPIPNALTTQEVTDSQKAHQSTLDKLKTSLQELITRKEKQISRNTPQIAKYKKELEGLLTALMTLNESQGVSLVIDEVHSRLLGTEDKQGVVSQVKKLSEKLTKSLADNSLSREEMLSTITKLREFQQYVKDFSSLKDFYHLLPEGSTGDKDSPRQKLSDIRWAQDELLGQYQKTIEPLMVKMLSPYMSKTAVSSAIALHNAIRTTEALIEKAEAKGDVQSVVRLTKNLDNKKRKLNLSASDEEQLLAQLKATTQDIGVMEYLFGTLTNSPDAILSTFSLFVKDFRVTLDQKMQSLGIEAYTQLQKYKNASGKSLVDPAKFNEGLYEFITRGDRVEAHFIREVDYNKYYAAESQMYAEADNLLPEEGNAIIHNWYRDNTQAKPQAEIDEILSDKREQVKNGILTQEEYTDWLASVQYTDPILGSVQYKRELSMPSLKKYTNKTWTTLQADSSKKAYFDYLFNLQQEADKLLPEKSRLGTRLPNFRKGLVDAQLDKTLTGKALWERLKGQFSTDVYADELTYGIEGDLVPVKHTGKLPASEVSLDLLSSVLLFTQAASTYSQNTQILPFAQSLKETLADREILASDKLGDKILRAAASKVGADVSIVKGEGGNALQHLEHFIDTVLLGKEEKKVTVGNVDVGKVVKATMSLASKTQIGGPFNFIKAIANYIAADISVGLEQWAGDHLPPGSWRAGKTAIAKYLGSADALKDFSSPVSTSLTGQFIDHYSPIPEGFKDQFGREISTAQVRRRLSSGSWFMLSKLGEMGAQYGMFLGLASKTLVKVKGGTSIPLSEAYELDENKQLRLKAGIEWSSEQERIFKNKLDALSKRLHGTYNDFDKGVVAKSSLGRVLIMYKKFLEPAIKRRYGAYQINQELDSEQEGYYRTFWNTFTNDWREGLKALQEGKDYNGGQLTEREVKNLRTSLKEMAFVATMMVVSSVLAGMGDDDKKLKDNTAYQLLLYQTMRQGSELGLYLPGIGSSDQLRLFSSPSALTTTLERMVKLSGQVLPWNITEGYTTTSKWHHKGDSKVAGQMTALLGLNSADPEKVLDNYRRFF